MAQSTTVIAALKYEGGVVIAADSQVSDTHAAVRWPLEKLSSLRGGPVVVGLSGSGGQAQRARKALDSIHFHSNQFKKRDLIRDAIERELEPIYEEIKKKNPSPTSPIWEITLWGLVAYWAEDGPQIPELEPNGDSYYHEAFHSVGSGASTARAIWRTLGRERLCGVPEAKAILASLRTMRTCVDVELWGVDEPFSCWVVSRDNSRPLSKAEIETHAQYVDAWEQRDMESFLTP